MALPEAALKSPAADPEGPADSSECGPVAGVLDDLPAPPDEVNTGVESDPPPVVEVWAWRDAPAEWRELTDVWAPTWIVVSNGADDLALQIATELPGAAGALEIDLPDGRSAFVVTRRS